MHNMIPTLVVVFGVQFILFLSACVLHWLWRSAAGAIVVSVTVLFVALGAVFISIFAWPGLIVYGLSEYLVALALFPWMLLIAAIWLTQSSWKAAGEAWRNRA